MTTVQCVKRLCWVLLAEVLVLGCSSPNRHDAPKGIGLALVSTTATCQVTKSGSHTLFSFTDVFDCKDHPGLGCNGEEPLAYIQTGDFDTVGGSVTQSLRVSRRGDLVLVIDFSWISGSSTTTVQYGSVFHGIRSATFNSDGAMLGGTVDGRTLVPSPVSAGYGNLVFSDGNPGPKVNLNTHTERAIAGLLGVVPSDISIACAGAPSSAAEALRTNGAASPSSGSIDATVAAASLLAGSLAPTGAPATAGTSSKCTDCQDSCISTGEKCMGGVALGCVATLFGYGACVELAAVGCSLTVMACGDDCDKPGGDCCPVQCPGGSCCDEGTTCYLSNNGVGCCPGAQIVCGGACCPVGIATCNHDTCCPADRTVCSGHCCPEGITSCNQGTCCPANVEPCGSVCCGAGEKCADPTTGLCCAAGTETCGKTCCGGGLTCKSTDPAPLCCGASDTTCNGQCCNSGQSCVNGSCCVGSECGGQCCLGACINGQCCSNGTECGGSCCPSPHSCCGGQCCDGTCVSGQCCPSGRQACGNVCCGEGLRCSDPSTSTCQQCPDGSTGVLDLITNETVCCSAGVIACGGVCCGAGDISCCGPPLGACSTTWDACVH